MKKRILIHSEFSQLRTGYSSITRNLCKLFHESGKYEVAEFANYGHVDYPDKKSIPWATYMGGPGTRFNEPPSDSEQAEFNSDPLNQFGKWRMNDALLHFKPDVVISYLDHWMSAYVLHSPFKHCFNFIWVPTCDGSPQNEQWIADFIECDAVLTYSDFAHKTLTEEGGGLINIKGVAPPGVDSKVFMPVPNKKQHKQMYGLPADAKIIGTVMRNQRRKLFPDLFVGFSEFLKKCKDNGREDLALKTFLYCHTSYPDLGWDIPRLLKETGLSHKVLFTYLCYDCGAAFPAFFQDAMCICPACGKPTARLPNTQKGITDDSLASIYNTFDLYVQYANSEGLGMPAVEAASCAIPVMYTDYSGMEDFATKLNGIPVKPLGFVRESETHVNRCLPDNMDFANKLYDTLLLPDAILQKRGYSARKGAMQHYSWELTAKKLMATIDELPSKFWNAPPKIHVNIPQEPQGLSDKEFVSWAIINILGEPELLNSYIASIWLKELTLQFTPNYGDQYVTEDSLLGTRNRLSPFTRNELKQRLLNLCQYRNQWEAKRVGLASWQPPVWLIKSLEK